MNNLKVTYIENNVQHEVAYKNISYSKLKRLKRKYLKADDKCKITVLELVVTYEYGNFLKTEILHSLNQQ